MSYKVDRSLGYQPWGVTNPWVFADLSQPQRQRGNVSPMVFQTAGPFLQSAHLGAAAPDQVASPEQQAEIEKLRQAVEEQARAEQQHTIAWASLAVSAGALLLSFASYREFRKRRLQPNRKRRRRRRRRRKS